MIALCVNRTIVSSPNRLSELDKKYKILLKFIEDCPDRFQLRSEPDQRGVYWIRLSDG